MSFSNNSFKDGETFEKFVEEVVFPASHFTLLEKTHNYQQNSSRFVLSSLNPDFKFKSLDSGRIFYVEAKFRSRYNQNDKLDLLSVKQYQRYKALDSRKYPVFLIVGVEGTPDRPKLISLIPIHAIQHPEVYRSVIYNHRIQTTVYPDYVLISNPPSNPTWASPNVSDIASGLSYKKAKPKRINYLAWILGFLILGMFSVFFLTQSSSSEDIPKETMVPVTTIRDKVEEYSKTAELNNTEALDFFLNDHLDRWYDKRNVSRSVVKKDLDTYNKRYPIRHLEIDWQTYQENKLANGDYMVSYNGSYRIKSVKSSKYQEFRLAIKSIWDPNMKLKSMYEEKLK